MKKEPIRIAQIMGKCVGGGVESVIMNYYRHIDRNKIQFDFICDEDSTDIPYNEIEKLGGRVILCPPYQKLFKYIKELKKIFKENNYKIVHSNINTLSVFPLYAAKKSGVPIRIAHSHSVINNNIREFKRNIIKRLLRPFSKVFANNYFSCSHIAAISLFGKKAFNNSKIKIIHNAIDVDKFSYNYIKRKKIRNQLKIKNDVFVIGHIGRFVETKNQEFIIDLFHDIYIYNQNCALILIGEGPLKNKLQEKVYKDGLNDSVFFLEQKTNIEDYYQAMDLFLFPSLYEGLGMTIIEAQCSNLPCIVSDAVPTEGKFLNNIEFLNLNNKNEWLKQIKKRIKEKKNRQDCAKIIDENGYNIRNEAKKLEKIYKKLFLFER